MQPSEIPRPEWPAFFASFVKKHHGHLCSLALSSGDKRVSLRPLLLSTVGPDPALRDEALLVLLADLAGERIAHIIRTPRHVFMNVVMEGVAETLEIDAESGRMVMSFEPVN